MQGRFGGLVLRSAEEPALLWVEARGFITPGLLRADLDSALVFGRAHPGGWTYLVDTTHVRAVHPLNPLLLRRIRRLPHLSEYLVLAPSPVTRALVWLAAPLVRPDAVLRSVDEVALRLGLTP